MACRLLLFRPSSKMMIPYCTWYPYMSSESAQGLERQLYIRPKLIGKVSPHVQLSLHCLKIIHYRKF